MTFRGYCVECGAFNSASHYKKPGFVCSTYERFKQHKAWKDGEEDCWHPVGTALIEEEVEE